MITRTLRSDDETLAAFMEKAGFYGHVSNHFGDYTAVCYRCDWKHFQSAVTLATRGLYALAEQIQRHAASHLPLPPEPPDPAAGYAGADLVTQIDPLKGYSGLRGL